jgi:hypothetical protein
LLTFYPSASIPSAALAPNLPSIAGLGGNSHLHQQEAELMGGLMGGLIRILSITIKYMDQASCTSISTFEKEEEALPDGTERSNYRALTPRK